MPEEDPYHILPITMPRRRTSSSKHHRARNPHSYSSPRLLSTSWLPILLLTSIATPSLATPISYFPLNSQLPPVARVSEPFSFVFSAQTFFSTENMTYSLADGAPAWLSLDGPSRRLYGTPDDSSVPEDETLVGTQIVLVAADETGSIDANATLVVSRSAGPTVRLPLDQQIQDFGPYSAPSSVLLYPSREFGFEFDPNTFGVGFAKAVQGEGIKYAIIADEEQEISGGGMKVKEPNFNYYATSGDNAPLPSWVTFDADNLEFSGKTPPFESLVQPPQTFDFQLIASDVVGFSAVSIPFSIVVGTHELTSDQPVVQLNATRGKVLEYDDLPNILKIDKRPLQSSDLTSITADGLPTWLSFDETSWAVSGTPDAAAGPVNVTIVVVDQFFDSLNVTLAINMDAQVFVTDLPDLNVSNGHDFSYDLKRYLYDPKDTKIDIETTPNTSWIQFDDSSQTISGSVPETLSDGSPSSIKVTLNGKETRTGDEETKDFSVHVSYTPTSPRKPLPSPSPSESPSPTTKDGDRHKDLLWLLVLLFLIVPLIIYLFFLWRKRRQRSKKLDYADISGPEPGSLVINSSGDGSLQDMRQMLDIGPSSASVRSDRHKPVGMSKLRSSQTRSPSSVEDEYAIPHAVMHSGAVKSAKKDNELAETRASWLLGQKSKPSPMGTDEMSLLSDTSIGEGETHIATEDLSPTTHTSCSTAYGKKPTLNVPIPTEPFSIQPTPELAYTAGGRYDFVSDDETPPAVGYSTRRRSAAPQNAGLALRGVQQRLSKVWKRGSTSKTPDEMKRQSNLSVATDVTTRTSILTTGFAEEATATSTNVVAKPTVIHIPSRPGEARQVSRRTQDSTTFFSGRSLTKSQRNFGLSELASESSSEGMPKPPPTSLRDPDRVRDSDTSWDQLARNSLGIAYKDLIKAGPGGQWKGKETNENWRLHATSQELMSPDQWPIPSSFADLESTTDVLRSNSEPPHPAPLRTHTKTEPRVTPKGKGERIADPNNSQRSASSASSLSSAHTPSTQTHSGRQPSDEEGLRMSRIREHQALEEFRAMISKRSSPSDESTRPTVRPLPETPTRTHLNGSDRSGGLKSAVSKRSVRTVQSTKSTHSAWTGGGDDDEWEDVRPAESMVGGWDKRSDGSFSVYI